MTIMEFDEPAPFHPLRAPAAGLSILDLGGSVSLPAGQVEWPQGPGTIINVQAGPVEFVRESR